MLSIIAIIVFVLIIVGIIAFFAVKDKKEEFKKTGKYPEGHFVGMWIGIGIAMFSGIGIPISIATENPGLMGIGPALGVCFGLAIGQSIENKHKKEGKIRPLTEEEKKRRKTAMTAGIILLLLGSAVFLFMLLR